MVVRWTFQTIEDPPITVTFPINPNEGGSPQVDKQLNIQSSVGPRRHTIIQEGQSGPPTLNFSGVILTQAHLELFETWFDRKYLLILTDDLGRQSKGVFSSFRPERVFKPNNPYYHRYQATFHCYSVKQASGKVLYGVW